MEAFKNTELYSFIYSQIEEKWDDYEKDGNIEEVMEEFEYYYGNHENSIYEYDYYEYDAFDILKAQGFIMEMCEEYGLDMEMKDIINLRGLQKHLLYWIMNDFVRMHQSTQVNDWIMEDFNKSG